MGASGMRRKRRERSDAARSDPAGWRGSPAWPDFRHDGYTGEGVAERLRWLARRWPYPRLLTWMLAFLAIAFLAGGLIDLTLGSR